MNGDSQPNLIAARERSLSIVVPAYNEARRIVRSLRSIGEWACDRERSVELIIVDDGSDDQTATIVESTIAPNNLRRTVLKHDANRGKGAALRSGVAASTADLVLLCDADLSTPLGELQALESALDRGSHIAIASRDMPDSRLDPPQPLSRRLLAWAFRTLRRRLLLPTIRDTQCGFKLWRGDLARTVFANCRTDGWLIDCESLVIAAARGARIAEVGVRWKNDPDSRVRVWRDLPGTLRELQRIRQAVVRESGR